MAYPYCNITDLKMFASIFFCTTPRTPLLVLGHGSSTLMFYHNDHQLVLKIRYDIH